MPDIKLIAFAGYAREGKDEACRGLLKNGWKRFNFGDIIKRQVDPIVRQHLGFSAFTEDDSQKKLIRGLLEQWGEANYDGVMAEYFANLPEKAVNTRLVRVREAEEWIRRGGIIIRIRRPGIESATAWEHDRLKELYDRGFISYEIENSGSAADLQSEVVMVSIFGPPVSLTDNDATVST